MKTKRLVLVIALLVSGVGLLTLYGQNAAVEKKPYIGVRLDSRPLSNLLLKHLQLKDDEALLVRNVQVGSPADKAGLEQDDIITKFQGHKVGSYELFVDAITKEAVGADVTLDVIHNGERKQVTLTLGDRGDATMDWKYPVEPDEYESWQPGQFYRVDPGNQNWQAIPFDQIPGNGKNSIKQYFNEHYTYKQSDGNQTYEITIDGNPRDVDATITVKIDNDSYKTTIGELDKLPEEYREAAEQAIEKAKNSHSFSMPQGQFHMPRVPDMNQFFNRPFGGNRMNGPMGGDPFEHMQKQMEEMHKRMREMEQQFFNRPDGGGLDDDDLEPLPMDEDDDTEKL